MAQIIIELTDSERERLTALAKRTGKPESTVVREALQQHLDSMQLDTVVDDPLLAAFGLWKELEIDALEYQRRVRSEWNCDQANPS